MSEAGSGGEPIYEARMRIVSTSDFGYPLQALLAGSPPLPPGGARFDVGFEGAVEGRRLSGTLSGVDHVYVRGDGRIELHIHGRLVTGDGAAVSFGGGGVAVPDPPSGLVNMYDHVTLHTADPRYLWVNDLPIWGRGTLDLGRGEIRVTGFTSARNTATPGVVAP